MDETALSLGTIDVSYLSTSAECSISRCKHSSEEWVSKNCEWYCPYLSYFFFKSQEDFFIIIIMKNEDKASPLSCMIQFGFSLT